MYAETDGGAHPDRPLRVDHNRGSKPSQFQGDLCCLLANNDYDCAQPASIGVATMCLTNVSSRNSALQHDRKEQRIMPRTAYTTDVTDAQWDVIESFVTVKCAVDWQPAIKNTSARYLTPSPRTRGEGRGEGPSACDCKLTDAGKIRLFSARAHGQEFEVIGEGF